MSSYKEGQTHQVLNALELVGFKPHHLTNMGQDKQTLADFRRVLDGEAEIMLFSKERIRRERRNKREKNKRNRDAAHLVYIGSVVNGHTVPIGWRVEFVASYLTQADARKKGEWVGVPSREVQSDVVFVGMMGTAHGWVFPHPLIPTSSRAYGVVFSPQVLPKDEFGRVARKISLADECIVDLPAK